MNGALFALEGRLVPARFYREIIEEWLTWSVHGCVNASLRGQQGGERGRGRCRLLVVYRGQRASLCRLWGPEALGQPLRESVGRQRRAARRGGCVFAREPEPRRGGGQRPRPRRRTSRASGAPIRPCYGSGWPRREGVSQVPRPPARSFRR